MKKRWVSVFVLLSFLFLQVLSLLGGKQEVAVLAASDGEGVANLDYIFESVDGSSISTGTDSGQATVIIFGKTNCGNSQGTVRSVAASKWVSRSDIRVIFAECNQASSGEAKSFAADYGCDDITFCYDERYSGSIYLAMWEYYDLFHAPDASNAGGALPFTVMIDGNNQVRQFLTGYQTADAIMDKMKEFVTAEDEASDNEETTVDVNIPGVQNYDYALEVLKLVNEARDKEGLPGLELDKELLEIAMQRAAEIAVYYNHTRPDGSSCFSISNRGTRKAENIAVGYANPTLVMNGWLNSQGHYANIMDSQVSCVGIGCFQDSQGTLNWVQFFDNAAADIPSVSGEEQITRTVSVQKKFLHLQTSADCIFDETVKGSTMAMEIWQDNEGWQGSKPRLSMSNFSFLSSNPATATVSEDGKITLKESGTAVITAFMKEDDSVRLEQTITIGQNLPSQSRIPGQTTTPGSTIGQTGTPAPGSLPNQSSVPGQTTNPNQGSMPKQSIAPVKGTEEREIPAKNSIIKDDSGNTYKVTGKGAVNGTVAYVKAKKNKVTTINVPSKVTIDHISYQVTSLSAKAFRGNTKLKKVIIGKNVRSIGEEAFYGCKNLKSIDIRTDSLTSQSIGKKAFKGTHTRATVKVPGKKLTGYKKLLQKRGMGKKVVFKKL